MRALKAVGGFIRGFMILFSFIVSLVLVIVLIALGLLIFDIKNNVAQPLLTGLHSSFAGLDEATIDWTIPVRAEVPVEFTVPLETDTVVVLTQAVPLSVSANINLPGVGSLNNAQVFLSLPAGLELPVRLDLDVPIDHDLPVELDVRAIIPISETQLHDPIQNLKLTFEPILRAIYNLPNNFNEAGTMVSDVLAGNAPDLLAENDYSRAPWPGFSRTAGVNYTLGDEAWPAENLPYQTGIVPLGGIPALDEQIRPELYVAGGPETINARAAGNLSSLALPQWFYDGSYNEVFFPDDEPVPDVLNTAGQPPAPTAQPGTGTNGDLGIIAPTPPPVSGAPQTDPYAGLPVVTPVIATPSGAFPPGGQVSPPDPGLQSAGAEAPPDPAGGAPPDTGGANGDLGILPTAEPSGAPPGGG